MPSYDLVARVGRDGADWVAACGSAEQQVRARRYSSLRALIADQASVDVARVRLVPDIPLPAPLSEEVLDFARQVLDQNFADTIRYNESTVVLREDDFAECIFHATARKRDDGRWRVWIQGMKDVEIVVTDIDNASDVMAQAVAIAGGFDDPDRVIVAVHYERQESATE